MAHEDFNTYVQEDPTSVISVEDGGNRIRVFKLDRRETQWAIKDKGVGFFDGDFEHNFAYDTLAGSDRSRGSFWMLSNTVNDLKYHIDNNLDYLTLRMASTGFFSIVLEESHGGLYVSDTFVTSTAALFWPTVVRDEVAGTLTAYLYTNSSRTVLADTLVITLQELEDFRYIYPIVGYNDGVFQEWGFDISDLDLGIPPFVLTGERRKLRRDNTRRTLKA